MNETLFKVGDCVRFTEQHAGQYSKSHYKGATGGVVSSVSPGFRGLRNAVYTLVGQTYGVHHYSLEANEGPW